MNLAARVLARFKNAGGSGFSVFVPGLDPNKAFREAYDEAKHESGHGGYTGTIAEKNGFKIRRQEPMTREEAHEFIDRDMDKNDKWGPAYAVPIAESAKTSEKKFKVKVPARDEWAAREGANKAVREKFAPQLQGGVTPILKIEKVTKLKEGKLPEMAVVKGGPEGFKVVGPGTQGKPFPTRAEAVAAFKQHVLNFKPQTGDKYEIVKFKTTDTFTIGDTTKSLHLFEVEGVMQLQKSTGKIVGWIFYGIASS